MWEAINNKLREPELVRAGVKAKLGELEEAVNEAKARISVLEARLRALERERQTIIRWARERRITERDMGIQLLGIEEKATVLQDQIVRAKEFETLTSREFDTQDLALRFYERIRDRLDYLSSEPLTGDKLRDRRELAKLLLQRVWINKDGEITVEGRIPEVREEPSFEFALPK